MRNKSRFQSWFMTVPAHLTKKICHFYEIITIEVNSVIRYYFDLSHNFAKIFG